MLLRQVVAIKDVSAWQPLNLYYIVPIYKTLKGVCGCVVQLGHNALTTTGCMDLVEAASKSALVVLDLTVGTVGHVAGFFYVDLC